MLRVSIIFLLFQVKFLKENTNLILMGKMLLIHAIEITPKNVYLSFTYYHDIGSMILRFNDKWFGTGSKNGINRPSLHGAKLTAEFPRVVGLGYIFLTHCVKLLECLWYHTAESTGPEEIVRGPHVGFSHCWPSIVGLVHVDRDLPKQGTAARSRRNILCICSSLLLYFGSRQPNYTHGSQCYLYPGDIQMCT